MVTNDDGLFAPSAGSRFDELFGGREVDSDLRSFLDGVPGVTLPPATPGRTPVPPVVTTAPTPVVASTSAAPSVERLPEAPVQAFSAAAPQAAMTELFGEETSVATAPALVPAAAPVGASSQASASPVWTAPAPAASSAAPYSTPASSASLGQGPVAEPSMRREAPAQKSPLAQRASEVEPALRAQIDNVDPEFVMAVRAVLELGASDLHLVAESRPVVRVDGQLKSVAGTSVWDRDRIRRVVDDFVPAEMMAEFDRDLELDLAYAVGEVARFRVNIFQDQRGVGAALRIIPTEIKSVAQLGLPAELVELANLPRGLVLVCGPTGSGKSTTLAAIIDRVNETRPAHIITVEDPIEFLHHHKRGIINQREVGADTHGFGHALKHALRQDPDVILVGEMRDLETISTALTAAETGHLVFATLHTQDAAQTIDRIIDVYPPHQQAQVRTQLAATLRAVVVQTLLRKSSGRGRVVATEVMFATPAIQALVRAGKTHQMRTSLQAGNAIGMHTLDQDLARLVLSGEVEYSVAQELAQDTTEFDQLVRNRGLNRQDFGEVPMGTREVAGGSGGA